MEIELIKGNKGLGFSIAGGIGNQHIPGDNGIYITKISEGGAAYADGRLAVGDKLISVRNTIQNTDRNLENVTHEEAVQTLKTTENRVVLVIMKPDPVTGFLASPSPSQQQPPNIRLDSPLRTVSTPQQQPEVKQSSRTPTPSQNQNQSKYETGSEIRSSQPELMSTSRTSLSRDENYTQRTVTLAKGSSGLGFNIVGGEENEGIFISFILAGGPADTSGQLHRGDQILQVNGIDITRASHEDAAHALKVSFSQVKVRIISHVFTTKIVEIFFILYRMPAPQ